MFAVLPSHCARGVTKAMLLRCATVDVLVVRRHSCSCGATRLHGRAMAEMWPIQAFDAAMRRAFSGNTSRQIRPVNQLTCHI